MARKKKSQEETTEELTDFIAEAKGKKQQSRRVEEIMKSIPARRARLRLPSARF